MTGPSNRPLFPPIMQPVIALWQGLGDRLRNSPGSRPTHFESVFTNWARAKEFLKSGFESVATVLIVALLLCAFVPYLSIRAPAIGIAKWWATRHSSHEPGYGASR